MVPSAAENERLRGENARLVKLLHDLTPTGSEFIDDPDNCAAWIRTALTSRCEAIVKSRCVISEMRTRIAELEAALVQIKEHYGQVCEDFGTCAHAACQSSYGAWETARQALGDNVAQTGADYE